MIASPLLFVGECARVVEEDPVGNGRRGFDALRPWPAADADAISAIPIEIHRAELDQRFAYALTDF